MPDFPFDPDRPSESDSFGRQQFAKSLANALLSVGTSDGFVVGIEGEWGTGKSTIIGLAKAELLSLAGEDSGPIIVEFNPWMIAGANALVEALIVQIASAIGVQADVAGDGLKIGQKLLGYAGLLKHLKYLKYAPGLTLIGNIAEGVGTMAGAAGAAAEAAADSAGTAKTILDDIRGVLPTLDLAKRKSEVADGLRALNRPVVVIVDDIDRLTSEEIRTVVQAIKAVADFPRMSYLLAYDRKVVAKALGYDDESAGLSYLEKIVQIAYPIPPLFQYQLRAFIGAKLDGLLKTLGIAVRPFEIEDLGRAIDLTARLVRHPRDVARLLNRLLISLPATYTEVNLLDAIVFESLSQRYPQLREIIHAHPEDFIGQGFRGDAEDDSDPFSSRGRASAGEHRDEKVRTWERRLPPSEPDRRILMQACDFLFPRKEGSRGDIAEDRLRLADRDRLARYFRMASLDNVPEARDMHDMLRNPVRLAVSLDECDERDLRFQLEWLSNYVPSCTAPQVKGCVAVLVTEASSRNSCGMLTEDLAEGFERLAERLLRSAPVESRAEIFEAAIRSAPLGIAEHLLLEASAEQGKWAVRPEMEKAPGSRMIEKESVVDEALFIWSERVRESSLKNVLHLEPSLHSILFRYAQLNYDYPAVYGFVNRICATDDGLSAFLSRYQKRNHFNTADQFGLIEDAQAFVHRITASSIKDRYNWLSQLLSRDLYVNAIAELAANHKTLVRPDRSGRPKRGPVG